MHTPILEDERDIAADVKRGLEQAGYPVDVASTGRETLDWADGVSFDAIIVLDLPLPEVDGLTVCRELCSREARTPILTLTARDGAEDCTTGVGAGAGDYPVKPFALGELLARLRALAARTDERPRRHMLQIVVAAPREAWRPARAARRGKMPVR